MNDKEEFVSVLINRNISSFQETFQYRVPDSLKAKINIGSRVIVPFGSTMVDGFVLQFEDRPVANNVKDIVSQVDSELKLESSFIDLARWMSKMYMTPLVTCLRCFIPSGSISKVKRYVSVNEKANNSELNFLEKKIVTFVQSKKYVLYSQLCREFKKNTSCIRGLIAKGILIEQFKLETGTRRKKIKKVFLQKNKDVALRLLHSRAYKQRQVINLLSQNGLPLKKIIELAECDYGTIKRLQKKGIVSIREHELTTNENINYIKKNIEPLTGEQKNILETLKNNLNFHNSSRYLLHGITGSGKTEIYVNLINEVIKTGHQVIVLAPEITLTLELVRRLRGEFGEAVAVLHSGLTASEKYDYWCKISKGQCKIVVGARSAVFAPCNKLGLVIIDEEHEWTYKQETNPKYHAREIAWKRIRMNGGMLLLGSATPSVETYWSALFKDIQLLKMNKRIFNRPLPEVTVIDMREEIKKGNYNIFSSELMAALNEVLKKKESAIIFINRRGYASFVLCRSCGFVMMCPNCQVTLTLHKEYNSLQCHYCHYIQKLPPFCPSCKSGHWKLFGTGTQRVEEELVKLFGKDHILRVDSDTTSKRGAVKTLLERFQNEGGIMVGTQMIAKGLDFQSVTLVGVIDADMILNLPDFRARERTFQLLTQVAGRAGRGEKRGRVIIQTYNPDNPSIVAASNHDFHLFYQKEIFQRKHFKYPPFAHILRVVVSHKRRDRAETAIEMIKKILSGKIKGYENVITVLGPAPSPILKLKGRYRWQLTIKTKNLQYARNILSHSLNIFLQEFRAQINIDVDINPYGMT